MLALLSWLQSWPIGLSWVLLFSFCLVSLSVLHRIFGRTGLFAYMGIAMVVSNIQILKLIEFPLYESPIPMGTTVFSTIFLCNDLINECYGRLASLRGVWLSFAFFTCFTGLMIITLGFDPTLSPPYDVTCASHHDALMEIFAPSGGLLLASVTAYLLSQYYDSWIFSWLSHLTSGRALWLRGIFSLVIASFIDNIIFSILAWRLFAVTAIPWETVIWSYILGTIWGRLVLAAASVPALYLLRYLRPPALAAPALRLPTLNPQEDPLDDLS